MQAGGNCHNLRLDTQKLIDLPVASPLLSGLLNVINDDDITIREFAAMIRQDPVLAARIIGLSNSAYFGQAHPITSVEEAIFKSLGLRMTKSLVLSIAMAGNFGSFQQFPAFDIQRYWLEAILCAYLARELCVHLPAAHRADIDDAYLSGLLHDFGMLPVIYLYYDEVKPIINKTTAPEEFSQAMRILLGADHHQVGAWLAHKWQIPENIVTVLAHYPEAEYQGNHADLVNLIHGVVMLIRAILANEEVNMEMPAARFLMQTLGVDETRLMATVENLLHKRDGLEIISTELARSETA